MTSNLENVNNMRDDNNERTSSPKYGGVDYFYIGSFVGGDDVIGGIIENLLNYPNEPDTLVVDSGCSYDDCPVVISDEYPNAETLFSYDIQSTEYHREPEGLVVTRKSPILEIGSSAPKLFSVSGGVESKLTKYSEVLKFVNGYVKTIDDKTYKGNK